MPNAGACVCMRTVDALRFGGFDEHRSLQGYLCGPYELGWRLVNAGLPEIWHDESMTSWHFQHPEPLGLEGCVFSLKRWREVAYPHVDYHALTAVDAFSSGRLLPLKENPEVHARRMALRRIGTKFEEKYATMTGPQGFTRRQRFQMHLKLLHEAQTRMLRALGCKLGLDPFLKQMGRSVQCRVDRLRGRGPALAANPPKPAGRREVPATAGPLARAERTIILRFERTHADARLQGGPAGQMFCLHARSWNSSWKSGSR